LFKYNFELEQARRHEKKENYERHYKEGAAIELTD
jgi:hypothetical protein